MKYLFVLITILGSLSLNAETAEMIEETVPMEMQTIVIAPEVNTVQVQEVQKEQVQTLHLEEKIHISVVGQGVAPLNTSSPAQAYALAKRAAVADAYRLIAEKVKGVRIDGQDLIKNMMVKRSTVRTSVAAMIRNASIVETTFKEGLCEVEMEIVISHAQFK
ncbi:LPP20 family lipoprotein [Sulfurimonas sp. SAG-AH-194-C21]|nr:LPP20 family lipoprotein [Sulfurimonas sp. SAG-AH-194-C21]MDF1882909.1 LPP20 family lipoprotein [Sulfurimonas sp. SAG-AH-194-C21]